VDCAAPTAAPDAPDAAAVGGDDGGVSEDEIEAILRASQAVETPAAADAGVARDAARPTGDRGIARPR
jgi:hypothetical protein